MRTRTRFFRIIPADKKLWLSRADYYCLMKSKLKANKLNRREAKCKTSYGQHSRRCSFEQTAKYDTVRHLSALKYYFIVFTSITIFIQRSWVFQETTAEHQPVLRYKQKPYYDVIEDEEKVKRFSVIWLPDERRRRWFSHLYVVLMICDSGLDESIELVKVEVGS